MTTSLILSFIFLILGLIHLNWVIGGEFGFAQSLPTKENGERILNPKKADSAIVGIGLIFFAMFYIFKSGIINHQIPGWVMKYGGWIIPSIFILRAIGDFKYVGFFKKLKDTDFGKRDTKFFSPLCLIIGILGFIIQII
ncbi:DUF3995 domain-containing protein [Mangrovivirga sp. M17]|uniref:DUF3995 domain-containing protein n=1 Tax=Mangrovivirga halotolerans TaxID=2993936 RepID=A0ABT3RW93_9BACT|nr:DUF3995 domain-containing protein [Mangrovivirga halotolerans]MCX2745492.1 DUF3995 domain-containing protein [Mangrovivirga halotolerans]